MKTKILFPLNSGLKAGSEVSALKLIDGLKREKYEPVVVLPFLGDMVYELQKRHIEYHIFKGYKYNIFSWIQFYILIKNGHINIVHLYTTRLFAIIAFFAGVKVIERVNMNRTYSLPCVGLIPGIDYVLSLFITKIIAVSASIKKELVKKHINKKKIRVIYNGINSKTFRYSSDKKAVRKRFGVNDDAIVIGTVARLEYQKGLFFFIDAIPRVVEQFPKATFLIVGRGSLKEQLIQRAHSLGVTKYIAFTGFCSDIANVMNSFDVFVLPSLWEPFPNVLLEAMILGKPVVATHVGGIPELVKEKKTGLLIPPKNSEALGNACITLLTNEELRKTIGRNARELIVAHYTDHQMIQKTCRVYDELLGRIEK
ncbi:glycosyltransferase family 4 protein [Chlamydiota bacterium]